MRKPFNGVLHTFCVKKNCISNNSVITVENHLYTKFGKKYLKKIENHKCIGDLKKSNVFGYACSFMYFILFLRI